MSILEHTVVNPDFLLYRPVDGVTVELPLHVRGQETTREVWARVPDSKGRPPRIKRRVGGFKAADNTVRATCRLADSELPKGAPVEITGPVGSR